MTYTKHLPNFVTSTRGACLSFKEQMFGRKHARWDRGCLSSLWRAARGAVLNCSPCLGCSWKLSTWEAFSHCLLLSNAAALKCVIWLCTCYFLLSLPHRMMLNNTDSLPYKHQPFTYNYWRNSALQLKLVTWMRYLSSQNCSFMYFYFVLWKHFA